MRPASSSSMVVSWCGASSRREPSHGGLTWRKPRAAPRVKHAAKHPAFRRINPRRQPPMDTLAPRSTEHPRTTATQTPRHAHVADRAAYDRLVAEARADYPGYWARLAREFV